jgi:nicotinamidase-related amidase
VKALIIVDMLDDFVTGKLANPRAQAIVPPLVRLLAHARAEGWAIVFSNDAHQPGDPELKIWGEHAMAGDPGAEVLAALEPHPGEREFVSPKRAYGAFDGIGLDQRLFAHEV